MFCVLLVMQPLGLSCVAHLSNTAKRSPPPPTEKRPCLISYGSWPICFQYRENPRRSQGFVTFGTCHSSTQSDSWWGIAANSYSSSTSESEPSLSESTFSQSRPHGVSTRPAAAHGKCGSLKNWWDQEDSVCWQLELTDHHCRAAVGIL